MAKTIFHDKLKVHPTLTHHEAHAHMKVDYGVKVE